MEIQLYDTQNTKLKFDGNRVKGVVKTVGNVFTYLEVKLDGEEFKETQRILKLENDVNFWKNKHENCLEEIKTRGLMTIKLEEDVKLAEEKRKIQIKEFKDKQKKLLEEQKIEEDKQSKEIKRLENLLKEFIQEEKEEQGIISAEKYNELVKRSKKIKNFNLRLRKLLIKRSKDHKEAKNKIIDLHEIQFNTTFKLFKDADALNKKFIVEKRALEENIEKLKLEIDNLKEDTKGCKDLEEGYKILTESKKKLQNTVNVNKRELKMKNEMINSANDTIDTLQKNQKEKDKTIVDLRKEIILKKNQITISQNEVKGLRKDNSKKTNKIYILKKDVKDLENVKEKCFEEIRKLKSEKIKLEKISPDYVKDLEERVEIVENDFKEYKLLTEGVNLVKDREPELGYPTYVEDIGDLQGEIMVTLIEKKIKFKIGNEKDFIFGIAPKSFLRGYLTIPNRDKSIKFFGEAEKTYFMRFKEYPDLPLVHADIEDLYIELRTNYKKLKQLVYDKSSEFGIKNINAQKKIKEQGEKIKKLESDLKNCKEEMKEPTGKEGFFGLWGKPTSQNFIINKKDL